MCIIREKFDRSCVSVRLLRSHLSFFLSTRNKDQRKERSSVFSRYDANVETILKRISTRLSSHIETYKAKYGVDGDSRKTKDIPFGRFYQELMKTNECKNLITLLLHLDGVSITRSTKLKMWLFSGCIVELPPKLRNQKSNMVVISIWVAHVEPISTLWLRRATAELEAIKLKGKALAQFQVVARGKCILDTKSLSRIPPNH